MKLTTLSNIVLIIALALTPLALMHAQIKSIAIVKGNQ